MPPIEIARIAIAALVCGVLAMAAASDVATRKIPNRSVLVIAALFVPWLFAAPHASILSALLSALAAAGIIFAATFGLYSLGLIGAGDSKLMTAVALFAGLGHLVQFVLATTLAGGLLAIASLVSSPTRALVLLQMRGKGDTRGVPYGVAIAVGGAVTLVAMLVRVAWPLR